MTRALVVLGALLLAACVGKASKPPALETAAPPARVTAPTARGLPASRPGLSAPVPSPAPTLEILYVKTHLANLREGAGTSMKILRVLRQGARLQVLESRNTWLRVRLDDGQEGWVAESVTSATAPVTPARAPTRDRGPSEIAGA
jgi:uncharacterized protein YgiM (DUF1202 family)